MIVRGHNNPFFISVGPEFNIYLFLSIDGVYNVRTEWIAENFGYAVCVGSTFIDFGEERFVSPVFLGDWLVKKLTDKIKADIWWKQEYEGGLESGVRHGAIIGYAEGTELEPLLLKLVAALDAVDEFMSKNGFEKAAMEIGED